MEIDKKSIKKILCIKPRGIGDIILSTIILDNLRNYFGNEIQIDYLTEHFAKPALANNPLVNKVISMDKTEFVFKAAKKVRAEKYDLVLDLWSNPRSAQITFLSRIRYRVGYAYRGRKYAYNILAPDDRGAHHSAEHNLELLKALKIPIVSKRIHYYTKDEDDIKANEFIKKSFASGIKIAGIIPAGGWESKRCEAAKWVDICKGLNAKFGFHFLILWGPGDEKDASFIKENLPDITMLAPKTELNQMASLIKKCDFIIANDSGPMHIAAALGRPTLGIFGPTNPEAHKPYSPISDYINKKELFCIVCNNLICPYNHECMTQLSVEDVVNKVEEILNLLS